MFAFIDLEQDVSFRSHSSDAFGSCMIFVSIFLSYEINLTWNYDVGLLDLNSAD